MKADLLSVVEAAYRVDGTEEEWLKGVVDAAHPALERGLGVYGFLYDLPSVATQAQFGHVYGVNLPASYGRKAELISAGLKLLPQGMLEEIFSASFCNTTSSTGGQLYDLIKAQAHVDGVYDNFSVNAIDPTGQGCTLISNLPKEYRAPLRTRARWGRISAHVAAGHRLQRRLTALRAKAAEDTAEAVLSPSGKVEHAEEPAQSKEARADLRNAALAVERARGKLRRSAPDEALNEWQGLVAARWSLIDLFDHDGKRYLLARRNDASLEAARRLSSREQQVVAYASLGHHNKLIAYELGIAASTVGVLLHRASIKLGVKTRGELISAYRATLSRDGEN